MSAAVEVRAGTSPPPDFQQAQKPVEGSQSLQIVAKRTKRREHKLTRVAFRVSRLMEFCTEKELVNQTGHPAQEWPLVLVKELFDNALDAAEESQVPPEIEMIVAKDGTITITDNANGIATETIEAVLDYSIRVSSREAYVSPTRGAQGNALKTILAMTYVLDRENDYNREINAEAVGVTIIETRGQLHCIEFRVDHVNSQPKLTHTVTPCARARGTAITVKWPKPGRRREDWLSLAEGCLKLLVEVVCVVQSAPDTARTLARQGVHQRQGHRSDLGEVASAQPHQPALVRREQAAALRRCARCQGPRA